MDDTIQKAAQGITPLMLFRQRLDALNNERTSQIANLYGHEEQIRISTENVRNSKGIIYTMNGEISELEKTIKTLSEQ